jgi:glycerate 2-kinase
VAPDKFKGTLSAGEAADAIAAGVASVFPEARITSVPMADGGEGTLDALMRCKGGKLLECEVEDPLGRPISAPIGLFEDGGAVVEMATASGLQLVVGREEPLRASSRGTGRSIARAIETMGDGSLIVGVGGSASTDGGTGAATAIGWRFLDRSGRDLSPGGAELARLESIAAPAVIPQSVVAACDVLTALTGEAGAARRFAPQKGATPEQVERLEAGLLKLEEVVERELALDLRRIPGAGAGGGMGAGLAAFFGADVRLGSDVVAGVVGLDGVLAGATLAITGEGRLDVASTTGKVPAGVAERAGRAGVPCLVVAGEVALTDDEVARAGYADAIGITSMDDRHGRPAEEVARATEALLRAYSKQM